jgi:hypothetical protein
MLAEIGTKSVFFFTCFILFGFSPTIFLPHVTDQKTHVLVVRRVKPEHSAEKIAGW